MKLGLKYYKNPLLREKCRAIDAITEEIKQLAEDLVESVLAYDGAGLSAPQVGHLVRIFVIRYSNEVDEEGRPILCQPKVYINPKILAFSSSKETQLEGCLSIPGVAEEVTRPYKITVEAMNLKGEKFTEEVKGWCARAILHENDHLNGVLFFDRIPLVRKKKLKAKLQAIDHKFNT